VAALLGSGQYFFSGQVIAANLVATSSGLSQTGSALTPSGCAMQAHMHRP